MILPHRHNHDANQEEIYPGKLVIHDCDAKNLKMLMIVDSIDKDQNVLTSYIFPNWDRPKKKQRVGITKETVREHYSNWPCCLHNPTRFGIEFNKNQMRFENK